MAIKLISQISNVAGNGDVDLHQGGGIISGDGNLIVFDADSQNLVPGSPIGAGDDILLFNANTVSFKNLTAVESDGSTTTTQSSDVSSISADGTKVVFDSNVENLDPTITSNVANDIYLTTNIGATVPTQRLLTRGYDGDSFDASISADGNWVAFQTSATNFNSAVTNNLTDAADAADGDVDIILLQLSDPDNPIWVSQKSGLNGNAGNGSSIDPFVAVDSDGNPLVVFQSNIPANLLIDSTYTDTNGASDIFLWRNNVLTLVSHSVLNPKIAGDGDSDDPVISANGQFIAYESTADDLVISGTGVQDIYRYNIATNENTVISLRPNNEQTTANSDDPSISEDGTSIAFESLDANLVPSDDNGFRDVFVWKEGSGISLVSANDAGEEGNAPSSNPSISLNGLKIAFTSSSTNLDTSVLSQNGVDKQLFLVDLTAPPTISIDDPAAVNEDAGTVTFTVSLSAATTADVTVDYATADDTATAGIDYQAIGPTSLTIPAGSISETFTVNIIDDSDPEPEESFNANLSNPSSNASIADGTGVGTISANDAVLPTLSINDPAAVNEDAGTVTFTVSLSEATTADVTVDYATADDTATAGNDYQAISATTLTIPAGSTSETFTVNIIDDSDPEPNELFNVNLSNPSSNVTIADGTGVGAISANDTPSGSDDLLDFDGQSGSTSTDGSLFNSFFLLGGLTTDVSSTFDQIIDSIGLSGVSGTEIYNNITNNLDSYDVDGSPGVTSTDGSLVNSFFLLGGLTTDVSSTFDQIINSIGLSGVTGSEIYNNIQNIVVA